MRRRRFTQVLVVAVLAVLWTASAQEYAPDIDVNHPAIGYFDRPVNDPVARLVHRIEKGTATVEFEEGLGYLPGLLESLNINPDSQALVFSRTSFQAPRISPEHPRAIYFGDDVAVGYVPGAPEIEIAASDPVQGVIFYTMKAEPSEQPVFTRGAVCLKCHQGPATSGVPGFFIGSVFPDSLGAPSPVEAIITDHRTKFKDRWGGWYVNAARGQQKDRSNTVASNPAQPELLDPVPQNIRTLPFVVKRDNYAATTSDIVALMTFEHQTQMVNFITRAGWEARIADHEESRDALTQARLDATIEALIDYMLFVEEAPLKEPVEGVSTFTETFPERGLRDRHGRSLRDFDLETRLFRYPLSYMVHSEPFKALPEPVLSRVYERLHEILTGSDPAEKFEKLTEADRRAILEILIDTEPDLPEYWKGTVGRR